MVDAFATFQSTGKHNFQPRTYPYVLHVHVPPSPTSISTTLGSAGQLLTVHFSAGTHRLTHKRMSRNLSVKLISSLWQRRAQRCGSEVDAESAVVQTARHTSPRFLYLCWELVANVSRRLPVTRKGPASPIQQRPPSAQLSCFRNSFTSSSVRSFVTASVSRSPFPFLSSSHQSRHVRSSTDSGNVNVSTLNLPPMLGTLESSCGPQPLP